MGVADGFAAVGAGRGGWVAGRGGWLGGGDFGADVGGLVADLAAGVGLEVLQVAQPGGDETGRHGAQPGSGAVEGRVEVLQIVEDGLDVCCLVFLFIKMIMFICNIIMRG